MALHDLSMFFSWGIPANFLLTVEGKNASQKNAGCFSKMGEGLHHFPERTFSLHCLFYLAQASNNNFYARNK